MSKSKPFQKTPWKKVFHLIKEYFINSKKNEKVVAWLLLIGIIICVMATVALLFALSWWIAGFWAILASKMLTPFLISMAKFAGILAGWAMVNSFQNYLIGKLSIRWRNALTHKMTEQLLEGENNYLDLKRFPSAIDNIPQRIQEDVKNFVELTLQLGTGLLKSVLNFGVFVGILWQLGGVLLIPGYLVWVALIIAVGASIASHYIARSLAEKNKTKKHANAELRQDLDVLYDDAENIAEEHAENYYKNTLNTKIENIKDNANQILDTQSKLVAFQSFYTEISSMLPYLIAAPLYFSGSIALGQLMQIGMAFGEVSSSLSWFVENYETLASYKASIERVTELTHALQKDGLNANPKEIIREEAEIENIEIDLSIRPPKISTEISTEYIMRHLKIQFTPGVHTLLTGSSGLGKSTLFKVIAGTWKYGDGTVSVPKGKRLYFLPQKPTLPDDTLMAVLAYPEPIGTYTEVQYTTALQAVGGMNDFLHRLREKRSWSKELSGGQQQRISFARALLKKPDWLFLDEATSSLDEDGEQAVYSAVKKLEGTTVVSIGHRSTVKQYHSRIVFFSVKNTEREIDVREVNTL